MVAGSGAEHGGRGGNADSTHQPAGGQPVAGPSRARHGHSHRGINVRRPRHNAYKGTWTFTLFSSYNN